MPQILIIEDEEMIRKVVSKIFQDAGYGTDTASDGAEGLEKFRKCASDLVVTDIFMPNTNGLEVIKELRELNPDVKIIAISGSGALTGVNVREYAMELGANCYIRKPFKMDILLTATGALIKSSDLQVDNNEDICFNDSAR